MSIHVTRAPMVPLTPYDTKRSSYLKGLYTFFWLKNSKKFVLLIFKVHTFNNFSANFHRDRGTRI